MSFGSCWYQLACECTVARCIVRVAFPHPFSGAAVGCVAARGLAEPEHGSKRARLDAITLQEGDGAGTLACSVHHPSCIYSRGSLGLRVPNGSCFLLYPLAYWLSL